MSLATDIPQFFLRNVDHGANIKLIHSAGFTFDTVNITVDKMIFAYLKRGQKKEVTQKAIDEFLVGVRVF